MTLNQLHDYVDYEEKSNVFKNPGGELKPGERT